MNSGILTRQLFFIKLGESKGIANINNNNALIGLLVRLVTNTVAEPKSSKTKKSVIDSIY